MAEENKSHEYETKVGEQSGAAEVKDRGLFDFLGKKEEKKPQEEVNVSEFEQKVQVSEPETKKEEPKKEEEKKPTLLQKLHRSNSSSSSSSDEEEGEGGEKKKKKKERKGKKHEEDTAVPVEVVHTETPHEVPEDQKKGFLDKIKDKLPGNKKADEVPSPPPPADHSTAHTEAASAHEGGEAKEKKGFLEKIKEKLPGYHPKTEEEIKEKEKESDASH